MSSLRETIDRRVAGLLERPDLSIAELMTARKALAEQEKAEPLAPFTEEQMVREARPDTRHG